MEKYNIFFVALYSSFLAVVLTFIIHYDGTFGLQGKKEVQVQVQEVKALFQPLTLTKWESGEGERA